MGEHFIFDNEARGLFSLESHSFIHRPIHLKKNPAHLTYLYNMLQQTHQVRIKYHKLGLFIQISSVVLKLLNTLFCIS